MRSPVLFAALLAATFVSAGSGAETPPPPAAKTAAPEPEIGKIEGTEIARPNGGFLGVKTDGVTLSVTFYDKKKKKVAADVARIAVRWHDTKPRRVMLSATTPDTFASPGVFKPPFRYVAILVLMRGDDQEAETYTFNLNSI